MNYSETVIITCLFSHQLDCVKSCLLIGENSRTNLKESRSKVVLIKEEDDAGNNEDMKTVQTTHEVWEKEMEELGAIYLLSNLDSPSALAWALVQPFSNLLRCFQILEGTRHKLHLLKIGLARLSPWHFSRATTSDFSNWQVLCLIISDSDKLLIL